MEEITKKFLQNLDSSGDGSIEFNEFYSVLKDVIPSEEQIQFYWKKLVLIEFFLKLKVGWNSFV
jgi:hypothetical protein